MRSTFYVPEMLIQSALSHQVLLTHVHSKHFSVAYANHIVAFLTPLHTHYYLMDWRSFHYSTGLILSPSP